MDNKKIKLHDFNLTFFRKLIEQSLTVNQQLVLQISSDFVYGCATSNTKSLMKLWTIPLPKLLRQKSEEDENQVEMFPEDKEEIKFEPFDFFVLRGDIFKKFLNIHTEDFVDVEFTVVEDKKQASDFTIQSRLAGSNSLIETTYELSTEDLITSKVTDYETVIAAMRPTESMSKFNINDSQIRDIRRLIKNLHKTSSNNTAYLNFSYKPESNILTVSDKVFSIDIELDTTSDIKSDKVFNFMLLKTDFIMIGANGMSIYTDEETDKVIANYPYIGSVVNCISSKVSETELTEGMESAVDDTIDGLEDLDEFL